ncbi:urate hydroxylase PuuD, partial [Herbaspirillum sp. B65]|uniref:urate hydroxylase PuuD n=1 Tax=Herbaspirillum sp. B65 TaxID=137708 RepID=UPI0005C9A061
LVLAAIMAAGVLIRHFFNLRHKGRIAVAYPLAGVALLLVVAVAIAPRPVVPTVPVAQGAGGGASVATVPAVAPDFARIQSIITQRCATCHSDKPTQPGFATAPAGMMLHTPELIHQHAAKIFQRAVQTRDMPLANLTRMTDEERAELAAWFQAGAK